MAKRKKEPITSLGNENKLIVQKSLPLFALWQSELTLAEFKILDTYLSRIDSHHPEKRIVIFEKGELEKILGVQKINKKALEERLKHLMGNVVEIPDKNEKTGFQLLTLFEEAVAARDDCGLWQVKLECTQKAMKYIFNIENLGYLRYKLRCITSLASRYTYIMFIYIESNRYRKSWEVELSNLKKILNCDNAETYKEYKHFNNLILKTIHKEIHEKTECKYSYEPIKKGRSIVAVRFTVEKIPQENLEDASESQMVDEQCNEFTEEYKKELWHEPLEPFEFTKEELEEIDSVVSTIPEYKLPEDTAVGDSIDIMRYHYIDQKTKELLRRDSINKINNKFTYLLKMLQNDAKKE